MLLFLKNLLFTIVVPGTVACFLPLWIAAGTEGSGEASAFRYLGLVPLAVGAGIYLWCLWDFASYGRGTPAPIDAPKRLVVRGLYRSVRNPMYVGVLSAIAGWCVYFASASLCLYAVLVLMAFHVFVTVYEEPTLRRHFGAEYEAYCSRVNRWWPQLPGGWEEGDP